MSSFKATPPDEGKKWKFICATYTDEHYYKIPAEWNMKHIGMVEGKIYYKNVKQETADCWEIDDDKKLPRDITIVDKDNNMYMACEEFFECE